MITRDFSSEFNTLLGKVITPVFKQLGFLKKANNFKRVVNDLIQILNVQKSSWNSNNDISFTFNIGFFNIDIYEKTYEKAAPEFPKENDCFISIRSGLITHGFDKWYRLNTETSYEKLCYEVNEDLQRSAVNFFETFQSLNSMPGLFYRYPDLEKTIPTIQRFVFLTKVYSKDKASEFLLKEYEEALIPKSDIFMINFPNGAQIESKSIYKINKDYIESIKRIAKTYNLDLK